MVQFIDCGKLSSTNGNGFNISIFAIKDGIIRTNLKVNESMVDDEYGEFNFPIEIKEVDGFFKCAQLRLKSLNGCPKIITGSFICYENKLTSLEGCPKKVGGDFDIRDNTRKFTEEEVRAVCNVGGRVFV